MHRNVVFIAIIAIFLFVLQGVVLADDVIWDNGGNEQSWSDPGNWQGDALPQEGDDVFIYGPVDFLSNTGYSIDYDVIDTRITYNSISLNPYNPVIDFNPVVLTIQPSAYNYGLRANTLSLGEDGEVQVIHESGAHTWAYFSDMNIFSHGKYSMLGQGSLDVYNTLMIYRGGRLEQDDSAQVDATNVVVGEDVSSNIIAEYALNGGFASIRNLTVNKTGKVVNKARMTVQGEFIDKGEYTLDINATLLFNSPPYLTVVVGSDDENDEALFTHKGENHAINYYIGADETGSGSFGKYVYEDSGQFYIRPNYVYLGGENGKGVFSHKSDQSTTINNLFVGWKGEGDYEIDDDSADLTINQFYLGFEGSGEFMHKSGTVSVMNRFILGNSAGSDGKYFLLQGALNSHTGLLIGKEGSGEFDQTGASSSVNIDGSIMMANGLNGSAIYRVRGGSLFAKNIFIGSNLYSKGNAMFYQTSGRVEVDNTLQIMSAVNHGTKFYLQRGGDLIAAQENIGPYGSFYQYGGTNEFDNMDIAAGGVYTMANASELKGSLLHVENLGTFIKLNEESVYSVDDTRNDGVFYGAGDFTTEFHNFGGLLVGGMNSINSMNIYGDFYMDTDSTFQNPSLIFDIGDISGSLFTDYLSVSGEVDLLGSFNLHILNDQWNYEPAVGSVFHLISADQGIFGEFDYLSLPNLSGDKYWDMDYQPNDLYLYVRGRAPSSVVPEPSSIVLFLVGFGAVLGRRKSKVDLA